MELKKHQSFFDPEPLSEPIHIIGVGAIGSNVALQLAKLGIENIHLWDFDEVDEHNITNQAFNFKDVNKPKVEAMSLKLLDTNKHIEITIHPNGWKKGQKLKGFVFMCVDSVELRKEILEDNVNNVDIHIIVDGRIGLSEGQVYHAEWDINTQKEELIKMCDFKDDEVDEEQNACGTTLSIMPTVQITVSYMVSIFINYTKDVASPNKIVFDAFTFKTAEI